MYNSDDRPIKAKGKYDMNFIDWDNEWAAVYNKGYRADGSQDKNCPIQGMSWEVFESILQNEFETFEYQQEEMKNDDNKLQPQFVDQIKKMKMGKSSKDCSICQINFEKGQIIMKLPCSHIFHESCILPWFGKSSVCPNCKFDLKEHFKDKN